MDTRPDQRRRAGWVRPAVWIGAAGAVLFGLSRAPVAEAVAVVPSLRPAPLLLGACAACTALVNRAMLAREARTITGVAQPLEVELQLSATAVAANKTVKSGGLAGLALYLHHGRKVDAGRGPIVRAYVLVAAANQLAFVVLAVAALRFAPLPDTLSVPNGILWAVSGASVTAAVAAFVMGSQRRSLDHSVHSRAGALIRMLTHAGIDKALGLITMASSLDAAGLSLDARTKVIVYALTLVASAVAIVPAGVGVVEASSVTILVATGVAAGPAAVGVLTFRLLDLWLPVLLGLGLSRGTGWRRCATEDSSRHLLPA